MIFENTPEALAEKLTEIYNNYNFYLEKFEKIKERKEDFSIEKMVEQYVQAYKSLIK